MFVGPFEVLHGYPREVACHVTTRAHSRPASSRRGLLGESTEDRRIGLNMNYSIILLQMIQIIHMTIRIMPEFDREGRAVCQFWLQGGKHNVTPTDKNPSDESHPGDLLTPPLFEEGRRLQGSLKKQPKKNT